MKRLFSIGVILFFSLVTAGATEQGVVDHCAGIIRDFRQMPEKGIPKGVLRHSRGLAIMTVVKAGFIFSGKGGQGVVIARTGHGWSGPSFIATGGAGWGLQIGAQVTDFVIVLNNDSAVRAFSRGRNVTIGADVGGASGITNATKRFAPAFRAAPTRQAAKVATVSCSNRSVGRSPACTVDSMLSNRTSHSDVATVKRSACRTNFFGILGTAHAQQH